MITSRMRVIASVACIGVLVCAVAYAVVKGPISIKNGFGTGTEFRAWSEAEKWSYAMGFVNGISMASGVGASEKEMQWFVSSFMQPGMSNSQLAAIISKYLEEHPERWHEPLNFLSYSAFRESYNKSHPEQENKTPVLQGNMPDK